ncbi:MAG: OB-fold nucleic acid binding domain-containing protein [Candidatus Thorarchaeota archaeon]
MDRKEPHVISPDGLLLRLVAIVGEVVEKFQGRRNYAFITLDDGSGRIRIKGWGEKAERLRDVRFMSLVFVVGKVLILRSWS